MSKGIKLRFVRSNEAFDIYKASGNGIDTFIEVPRNTGLTEQQILESFFDEAEGRGK